MNARNFLAKTIRGGPVACIIAGIAAGLGATPLRADDSLRFGAGVHVVNPSGDLADDKKVGVRMGFGLSLFGEMGLGDKMALRGRADHNLFGEGGAAGAKRNASATTVFADCIYRFDSHGKGPYAFLGVGLVAGSFEFATAAATDFSGSNLGYAMGFGYNISRNMGFEASYTTAGKVVEADSGAWAYGFDWMQVSFKYRF